MVCLLLHLLLHSGFNNSPVKLSFIKVECVSIYKHVLRRYLALCFLLKVKHNIVRNLEHVNVYCQYQIPDVPN